MSEFFGWTSDDEQQPIRNETEIQPVSDEFKNLLTDCKRSIYMGIVFAEPEDTQKAQDVTLLNQYLRSLSALYGILNSLPNLPTENIDWTKEPWNAIPEVSREKTNSALLWYNNFIKHNKPVDRTKYKDYISSVLYRYPYSQLPTPDED
jgi:hypothetical protein